MALQLPETFSSPQDFDKATSANYTEVKVTHTHLEWTIDWDNHVFHGLAVLSLTALKEVGKVVLDTSYLDIKKVEVDGQEVKYTVGERRGTLGSALQFQLPEVVDKGEVSDSLPARHHESSSKLLA
jgi:leukotriene-A4 hydrolase